MGKGKHKSYPEKQKDAEVTRLKAALKRKDKEMDKLKSELATYETAFQKNIQFLKGKTKDLSLQELLEGAKKEQKLVEIEKNKELTFKEMEQKWKCHKCGIGLMKLIMFNRLNEKWYLRKCNDTKCDNRTEAQKWHEEVDGIK